MLGQLVVPRESCNRRDMNTTPRIPAAAIRSTLAAAAVALALCGATDGVHAAAARPPMLQAEPAR